MKRLFRILFAAASVVCAGSVVLLLLYYRSNREGSQEYAGLIRRAVTIRQSAEQSDEQFGRNTDNSQQAGELKNPPALFVDFEELRSVNEDIAAWIDFPGQGISYPVVQGEDNSHYLKYTFEGNRNGAGCIFADYRNQGLLNDDNTIIYGHNMRNGSMFGFLKKYLEQEHYEQFPYFDLYMPEGVYRCRIIAACRVPAREESYPTQFSASLERKQFISSMKSLCTYTIVPDSAGEDMPDTSAGTESSSQTMPEKELPLVMLSTCVGGGQYSHRFALLAEAVKAGE